MPSATPSTIVVPFGASDPPGGFCSTTVPAGRQSLTVVAWPAYSSAASVAMAWDSVMPTTDGTMELGKRGGGGKSSTGQPIVSMSERM